jgi:3-oxoacyl-[acyl-carrier-protein] synthase-3
VVGTTSPDVLWPSTACLVQAELELPMVGSFDLYAAEAGLLTALTVADRYVRAGTVAALVIGAESDSQLVRIPSDNGARQGCAASAVVLRAGTGEAGILASRAGGAPAPDGQSHDSVLLRGLAGSVQDCLASAGLSLDGIDLVIADQTAPEIMRAWARAERLPAGRLLLDPERYWQAFVAAPFIALHDAVLDGRVGEGATVLLLSCGRGPAWAVACLRWDGGGIRRC